MNYKDPKILDMIIKEKNDFAKSLIAISNDIIDNLRDKDFSKELVAQINIGGCATYVSCMIKSISLSTTNEKLARKDILLQFKEMLDAYMDD